LTGTANQRGKDGSRSIISSKTGCKVTSEERVSMIVTRAARVVTRATRVVLFEKIKFLF
jgi:hypothetical protein